MSGFTTARQHMVDGQVRPSDVTDIRILDAMLAVPREAFVPENKQALAYLDLDLDVSEAGAAKRYLIAPAVLAKMLQAAEIRETDRVLVVGCATGYAAAVLARMGLTVTAQESDAAVFEIAGPALADAGVTTVVAPLNQPAGEGYDLIVSEAAVPARPDPWLAALKVGGRLAVVERAGPAGKAVLYVKGESGVSRRELFDAAPPVLAELAPEPTFAL